MAQRKDTLYTSWTFSQEEEVMAVVLTDMQYKHIQTQIADAADAKAILAYDTAIPNSINEFLRAHEYNRGRIEILQFLLELSDTKKAELESLLKEQILNQEGE